MGKVAPDAEAEFGLLMTRAARRVLGGEERPYDVGLSLMAELVTPALAGAEHMGAAYCLWGGLTDGIDGPPRYARGLSTAEIEDLMRRAAAEWLALNPIPDEWRGYFERWNDWPESLTR